MTWTDYIRHAQGYWLRHSRYLEGCRMISHAVYVSVAGNKAPAARKAWPLITDPKEEEMVFVMPTAEEQKEILKRYGFDGRQ